MKRWIKVCFAVALNSLLMACTIGNGRICGPQTPIAYCDREAYEKLVHPKSYGAYWVKPGMTTESWRQDWVGCGGMKDGGYSSDAPSGSTSIVLRTAEKKKMDELSLCMASKGYEYR